MMLRSLILILLVSASTLAENLKVMTFNLRYASDRPPNSWPERRPVMKDCIAESDPDIIGTQEGVYHQLTDIESDLPQYRWIGLGRDGGSKGEFMAVFYKPEKVIPLEYDHFWLSDTPEVIASTTWGNSNRRMVTWVRFKQKSSGREFYFVNTHFDHQIQPAREKSATLIRERIGRLNAELPLVLLGDFNATAGRNKAYDILVGDKFLEDTWDTAGERRGEIVPTFHNFRGPGTGDDRIDWILGRNIATAWTAILTCARGKQYPSDHFPVIAEISFTR